MELRKKSLLIALTLGGEFLREYNSGIKKNVSLEIRSDSQKLEYLEWKANLCRKLTKTACNIKPCFYHNRYIGYRFSSSHKYFRVLRKWLYSNNIKQFKKKYLKYLDLQGIAIWYMDGGSTYIDNKKFYDSFQGNCEFNLYTSKKQAEEVISYFKECWNLSFYLHKCKNDIFKIRCYNNEAIKFINMIRPFIPQCMDYKVKIPEEYVHECLAS